jgi:predicted transcriptional regulator
MTDTAASARSRRRAAMTTAAATTTVGQNDHVAAASYLMKHAGTTALAVLDGQQSDQPIGCITETDIAEAMAEGNDLNEIRVRDLIVHSHATPARQVRARPLLASSGLGGLPTRRGDDAEASIR